MRTLVVLALALAMIGPVQAESRYYVTAEDTDEDLDACDTKTNYAASLEEPAAGQAYSAASGVGLACPFLASFTTTEDYQLSGDFHIEFWVGCTAGAMIELDYRLTIAGVDVVDVRPAVTATCGPDMLVQGGGVHATKDLFIPAGSDVVMRFALFAGPEPGEGPVRNVYITVGGDNPSGFSAPGWGVPIASSAPAVTFEQLDIPEVAHAFTNATSATYVFNFTASENHGVLDLQVNGTGLAHVTLTDGNGEALFNATAGTDVLELRNATPGDWQLTIAYDNFTGELSANYRDGALLATQSSPPQHVDGDATNVTHNATLHDTPDDQESPSLAWLPLLGLLAAVAMRRRT